MSSSSSPSKDAPATYEMMLLLVDTALPETEPPTMYFHGVLRVLSFLRAISQKIGEEAQRALAVYEKKGKKGLKKDEVKLLRRMVYKYIEKKKEYDFKAEILDLNLRNFHITRTLKHPPHDSEAAAGLIDEYFPLPIYSQESAFSSSSLPSLPRLSDERVTKRQREKMQELSAAFLRFKRKYKGSPEKFSQALMDADVKVAMNDVSSRSKDTSEAQTNYLHLNFSIEYSKLRELALKWVLQIGEDISALDTMFPPDDAAMEDALVQSNLNVTSNRDNKKNVSFNSEDPEVSWINKGSSQPKMSSSNSADSSDPLSMHTTNTNPNPNHTSPMKKPDIQAKEQRMASPPSIMSAKKRTASNDIFSPSEAASTATKKQKKTKTALGVYQSEVEMADEVGDTSGGQEGVSQEKNDSQNTQSTSYSSLGYVDVPDDILFQPPAFPYTSAQKGK